MRFLSGMGAFVSLGFNSIRSGLESRVITKVVCYVLFGCLTFSLFLGVHLAEDALELSFHKGVRGIKAVRIETEGVSLSLLPPRMKLDSLLISDAKSKNILYKMQRVVITPKLSALLIGIAELSLTSASYGGGVKLTASSGSFFDFEKIHVDLKLMQQALERIPFVTSFDPRVGGTGDVHLVYSCSPQKMEQGQGTLRVTGKNLRLTNPVPLVKVLVFDKMGLTGSLAYNNGNLTIKSVKLAGKPVNGELQGTARLNVKNPTRPKVALRTSLFVQPDKLVQTLVDKKSLKKLKAGKRVKIAINGQLTSPRFALK